ncbi:GerAB/ArcD/ProY family transporter [Paenibacillus allorhizosphaerae]|uniref:Spore germination protein YndE n=1 Tax=Paenibacillus allorhizosphaerae TaxID=2849866 RepID=A0ABN7TM86_9BACL|nr:GerAB/ArcD/ProY family transporter [Paenibacillus allorhizosphaerae]CAG7635202.1 Spore germination protein YndE [Paenibacillus allorhizosphaerae]
MTEQRERISDNQTAFMMVLFEIGSTPLFFLGSKAKQDAWLAMLFAAAFGLLLVYLYIAIQRKEPDRNLIGMLRTYFGRLLGSVLGAAYILYFGYESMRNVRDFGELMSQTLLTETPMSVTMLVVVLIAAYGVFKGVEVVFRLSEFLLPVLMISYGILILLLFVTNIVHFRQLLPVMENGAGPVLKAAFPDIVSFPFGQTVIFLMFWHLSGENGISVKATACAYLSVALFLIFMNALNIAVLGPTLAGISTLPFLQSVQLISVANVFERLDVFVTLLIYIGLFMKMIVFYLCAVIGLSQWTAKARNRFVLPVGIVIFAASFLEPNYTYHISLGFNVSLKLFTLFQIVIPVALWLVMLLSKYRTAVRM